MLDSFKQKLDGYAVSASDVPAALVAFNVMLWGEWAVVIALCCRFRPLRTIASFSTAKFARRKISTTIHNKFPERSLTYYEQKVVAKAESAASSRFVRPIPRMMNLSPKDFVFAMAETTVLYNCMFPVWIPFNLSSIAYCLAARKEKHHNNNTGNDNTPR